MVEMTFGTQKSYVRNAMNKQKHMAYQAKARLNFLNPQKKRL
jgi:hypothetical protein